MSINRVFHFRRLAYEWLRTGRCRIKANNWVESHLLCLKRLVETARTSWIPETFAVPALEVRSALLSFFPEFFPSQPPSWFWFPLCCSSALTNLIPLASLFLSPCALYRRTFFQFPQSSSTKFLRGFSSL